jgi:hypothetical protein
MEEDLLEKAKRYSADKGESLSKMVSGYFAVLTNPSSSSVKVSTRVRALRGVVRRDVDVKAEYTDYLEGKYLK